MEGPCRSRATIACQLPPASLFLRVSPDYETLAVPGGARGGHYHAGASPVIDHDRCGRDDSPSSAAGQRTLLQDRWPRASAPPQSAASSAPTNQLKPRGRTLPPAFSSSAQLVLVSASLLESSSAAASHSGWARSELQLSVAAAWLMSCDSYESAMLVEGSSALPRTAGGSTHRISRAPSHAADARSLPAVSEFRRVSQRHAPGPVGCDVSQRYT